MSTAKGKIGEVLDLADIKVNGNRPWDLRVGDERFYQRALSEGTLGIGESYMDGWWDVEALDEFFTRIHRADLYQKVRTPGVAWLALKARLFNRQTRSRSGKVAREHYDLGNELFERMLGPTMQYTSAYWRDTETLDQAQAAKMRLIAAKLKLEPGMTVLELGCGFGSLAHFLAADCGCRVVAYNNSEEQVRFGRELCAGLPVRFEEKDYRCARMETEQFDRIVAVGLCEHIGHKNHRSFLELAHERLKGGGLFLLHTIGANRSWTYTDPWVDRYIFPNGMMPSITQLGSAMEDRWVMEDWHNFGPDYDRTILAWWANFQRSWPGLRESYGDRFYRMWKFYLMASAAAFRARRLQLWQLVLSKGDITTYESVR